MCILITGFIFIFVYNLENCIDAALIGVNLVVKTIIPTIFPFSVICNLLISYDGVGLYSKILGPILCKPLKLSKSSSFPIVASFLSGYPLGCKYCCDLYSLGYINRSEFERLLNIASNASPMFIIGSIGATMLGDIRLGFILLIGNYLSSIIVGILTINDSKASLTWKELPKNNINVNFGSALKSALDNGINTTLQVGAFVVLFSIIISIIKNNTYISIVFYNIEEFLNLPKYSIYGLFLGSVEFTNGCKLITTLPLTLPFKLAIISFICSFSGLSVIAQISSFVYKYDISIAKYSFIKFIQGVISFSITFIISSVFSLKYTAYTSTTTIDNYNISLIISFSLSFLLIGTLIILLLKKLHRS
ncbi:sporulation integral membrane protein YlbJ [uncultured Clostridium sp.]|uniref:sporulation integral membrane protein YlbJ n=1 Tax=uncultured Clostridium sp. TaxID=59620 RepID=UPI0025E9A1E4|nr:sporulation integral membrane protein YlbJ [uncultured Clostridium sp.]MDU4883897.1 sporulation integral membrane protein YlbJ [Clostridium celatum]MDU7077147.1 sporulation integral membrane protein YlbJ [Clostridium celatum]